MPSTESLPPLFEEFPSVSTEEWESKIRDDLGSARYENVIQWDSLEGVSLPGYLRREDLDEIPHVADDASTSPLAGSDTVPANQWQVRQNVRHPDPAEANRLARSAVRRGAAAIGLVRPSLQKNREFGLTLETADDLRAVLDDVPLGDVSLHLDRGPAGAVLLAALRDVAVQRGEENELTGSVGFDPVGALAEGTVPDRSVAFAMADDLLRAPNVPSSFRTLSIDLRPYHDAGASAVQELAFGLGALSDLLAAFMDRGHTLPVVLPRLQFVASVSTSYFVEIAKLRALRLLVPQVIDAYAAETRQAVEYEPPDPFLQAETSRRTETIYDPYVNMLRATTEGMAAVVGGCNVLSVRPYDASLRPPDEFGSRVARNVQLILREEAHLDVVADPAAGAYYLEAATDQLAQRAWDTFQDLEADGGLVRALRGGRVQREIEGVRRERRREIDTRDRVLVGTNHYPALDERRGDDLDQPPSFVSTDGSLSLDDSGLDAVGTALADGHPISSVLAALADGEPAIEPLPRIRVSTGIEEMRLRTERYAAETDHTPTVVLAALGPARARSARANFARNVFGVAGFDVVEPLRFDVPDDAAQAAADADADIVVLCSADAEYGDLTPKLRSALDEIPVSPLLVVAGNPDQIDADLPADDFVHIGSPLRDKLVSFQERLGIRE